MKFFVFCLFCAIFVLAVDANYARTAQRQKHITSKYSLPEHFCRQKPDSGVCYERLIRWYHDGNTGECKPFVYKGCGGNHNNFFNRNTCEFTCRGIINQQLFVQRQMPKQYEVPYLPKEYQNPNQPFQSFGRPGDPAEPAKPVIKRMKYGMDFVTNNMVYSEPYEFDDSEFDIVEPESYDVVEDVIQPEVPKSCKILMTPLSYN